MIARAALAVVLVAAACGDSAPREEVFAAHGGSRLALQVYGFPDGTRQPEPGEFYDTVLHTRCKPTPWTDDVVRCVPVADDALFTDDQCSAVIGRADAIAEPTHFIGYDRVDGVPRPTRVYPAGDETTAIDEYYQRIDDACVGPFSTSSDATYFTVGGDLGAAGLVAIHDGEVGAGRLALGVRTSDDGALVPLGLRDRQLDVPCTPTQDLDGAVTCAPASFTDASLFADPSCSVPALVVDELSPVPTIARVIEASGCASYHGVGAEVATSAFRRDGDACVPAALGPSRRLRAVGAPLELPTLARSLEAIPGRRLQRVVLDDGALRFYDRRLFDTATGADCQLQSFGDVTRCSPAAVAPALRLFTATCVVATWVAEVPLRACPRPAFATGFTGETFGIMAMGDPVVGTVHHWVDDRCQPYVPTAGTVLHALGPPIDPTAFAGALYFGER